MNDRRSGKLVEGGGVRAPSPELLAALDRTVLARMGRRQGREVSFLCPAHDDHRPSARWNRAKAVWLCDACGTGGGALDLAKRLNLDQPAAPDRALQETVYQVRDAASRLIAEHVRQDLVGGGKRFFWRRDGRTGLGGVRTSDLPPYGAERVAGADPSRPVFVAEGEKAAACLDGIGALAVGTVTGANGTPGARSLAVLRGREVVLWPDADAAGQRHMERIAAALAGIASAVRIFAPGGLPAGGDAAEWIGQRSAAGQPAVAILRELENLASEAAPRADAEVRVAMAAPEQGAQTRLTDGVEAALAGLTAAGSAAAAEDWLRRLGKVLRGADPLTRALARESALAAIEGKAKAPALLVDAALMIPQPLPAAGQGRAVEFAEPAIWPDPVDGAVLLSDIAATLTRFVALPPFADVAAALWTVHAHALEAALASPLLALTSPEKRCGKTTTLSLLARLTPRALLSSNISSAALFRIVEKYSPTLLVDEADSFLRDKEELRGILNSGHTRDAAYVVRTVGDENEPRRFSTWAAKAVALIGRLPDTLADRSLVVPMRRRAPGESIERLRLDRPAGFEELRRRAARWAADHVAELRGADPEVPGELGDRAADNWRPLLAIADQAGGGWPERARLAAMALSGGGVEGTDSLGAQLLADIREVFGERQVDRIFSQELLQDLCSREERPWGEWGRARVHMSPRQLSARLKPFGVQPGSLRDGAKTGKGYTLEQFADAFARYLSSPELSDDPSRPSPIKADAGSRVSASHHNAASVTDRKNGANHCGTGVVTDVAGSEPDATEEGGPGGGSDGTSEDDPR